jgi:DNA-3-methyladenine glycosylase II
MPATRTSARLAGVAAALPAPSAKNGSTKAASIIRKQKQKRKPASGASSQHLANAFAGAVNVSANASLPANLTFSFTEAKEHLIAVDARFSELFGRLKCKPFEELEVVNPFRSVRVQTVTCVFPS